MSPVQISKNIEKQRPSFISTTIGALAANWEIAVFSVTLFASVLFFAIALGCRIDDAFIYLRVAENFFNSGLPTYNPGDGHFITTSPLWLFSIIAAKQIFWFVEVTVISKWLYIASLIAAAFCLRAICRERFPLAASLAPLAVFCSPLAIDAVGMEFAITLAMGLMLIRAYEREKWILFGVCGGLFYLARSEGALLTAAMMAVFVIRTYRRSPSLRECVTQIWPPIDACLLVVLIWHVYYYYSFGLLFPDTLHAKVEQGLSGIWPLFHQSIFKYLLATARGNMLILGLMIAGAPVMARRYPWIAIWALIQAAAYSSLRVPEYVWYYYPIIFAASLSLLLGVETALRIIRRKSPRFYPAAAVIPIGLVLYWSNLPQSRFAPLQDARRNAYQQAALWIRQHQTGPKTIVMDEIGIIGYCLKDYSIFDTVGLSSPDVTSKTMLKLEPQVRLRGPSFIVLRVPKGKPMPQASLTYSVAGERRPVKYRRGYTTDLKAGFAVSVYIRSPR